MSCDTSAERQAPIAERADHRPSTIDDGPSSIVPRVWISTAEAAELMGIAPQNVRKAFARGRLQGRISPAPGGGRRLEIGLASLPEAARQKWGVRNAECGINEEGSGAGEGGADPAGPGLCTPTSGAAAGGEPSQEQQKGLTPSDPWEGAREADRQAAVERMQILMAWREYVQASREPRAESREEPQAARHDRTRRTLEFLAYRTATQPQALAHLSKSTLYRWEALYRQRGRAGLLPGYSAGPKGHEIPDEVRARFHQIYMTPRRLTVAVSREIVAGGLRLSGSPLADQVPSPATFRRYVKTIPAGERIMAREGAEAFRRQCEPHMQRDYAQIAVMQCWVSDHAQFDFFCRDLTGRPIRPWVTLWMDVRSRLRVGWLIHAGPSQDTVLAALASGVLRYGIPLEAYTDNGRDYSSLTLAGASRRWRVKVEEARVKAMTEHLQMAWHFSLPGAPQGKGMIERAFGTDREHFDKVFASYCGRDNQRKPEGLEALLKHPRGLPSLQDVAAAYARYVEEVANAGPHEGQGMDGRSPRDVFASQEYVKRTATADELALLFMRVSKPVTIGRNGIRAFDRDYWSEAMAPRFGEKAYYRYRLDDISTIYAFTLQDQLIGKVSRIEIGGVTSADYREHLRRKQAARRIARQDQDQRALAAAHPDPLRALAAAKSRQGEGERGRGGDGEPPRPKVVQPIRSPFTAAAKALQAQQEAHDRRAVVQAQTAPKVHQLIRATTPEPSAEKSDGEKVHEIFRKLYRQSKSAL